MARPQLRRRAGDGTRGRLDLCRQGVDERIDDRHGLGPAPIRRHQAFGIGGRRRLAARGRERFVWIVGPSATPTDLERRLLDLGAEPGWV